MVITQEDLKKILKHLENNAKEWDRYVIKQHKEMEQEIEDDLGIDYNDIDLNDIKNESIVEGYKYAIKDLKSFISKINEKKNL